MIIVKEFTEQDKEQLLEMINEINEYDADFEGMDDIGRIEDYMYIIDACKKAMLEF